MEIDLEYTNTLTLLLTRFTLCGAKNPTVTGGAIRDMLLGKEIADIDVFYEGDLKDQDVQLFFQNSKPNPTHHYPDGFTVTYNMEIPEIPVKIQAICVGDVTSHIETFPTPLSRVSFNSKDGFQGITADFIKYAKNKHLVFDQPVDIHYYCKLEDKFFDYKIFFLEPEYSPLLMETEEEVPF